MHASIFGLRYGEHGIATGRGESRDPLVCILRLRHWGRHRDLFAGLLLNIGLPRPDVHLALVTPKDIAG